MEPSGVRPEDPYLRKRLARTLPLLTVIAIDVIPPDQIGDLGNLVIIEVFRRFLEIAYWGSQRLKNPRVYFHGAGDDRWNGHRVADHHSGTR